MQSRRTLETCRRAPLAGADGAEGEERTDEGDEGAREAAGRGKRSAGKRVNRRRGQILGLVILSYM